MLAMFATVPSLIAPLSSTVASSRPMKVGTTLTPPPPQTPSMPEQRGRKANAPLSCNSRWLEGGLVRLVRLVRTNNCLQDVLEGTDDAVTDACNFGNIAEFYRTALLLGSIFTLVAVGTTKLARNLEESVG